MHKCYHFSLRSQLSLHTVCGRWVPVNMGFLLPQQCLGEEASTACDSGDGYRAGGREWQVLERRELYGKVRTKITAVAGTRISICKSSSSTLGFSLGHCRMVWGFFCCCSHVNTNICSISGSLFCRWGGNFCDEAQIKFIFF